VLAIFTGAVVRHYLRDNPICARLTVRLAVCLLCALYVATNLSATAEAATIAYQVKWEGTLNDRLRDALTENSDVVAYRDRPPASLDHLRRRVQRDIETFARILQAEGYYAASIENRLTEGDAPITVTFSIDPGPRYAFGVIEVHAKAEVAFTWPPADRIGLHSGEPALSKAVVDAEGPLLDWARNRGFPFPTIAERNVVVDHAAHKVNVAYTVDPGASAVFGPTLVDGVESVKDETVRRSIAWTEGASFDARQVTKTQDQLYAQDLYSMVRVGTGDAVDTEARIPMRITVVERKPRTVSIGVGFDTDGGPTARAGWEHRNIDGLGHKLTLTGNISGDHQEAEARFLVPGWRREDQTLRLQLRLGNDSPDAYDSTHIGASATIERKLGPQWIAGGGVAFRYSMQEQRRLDETYHLLSFPMYALRDGTDDSMNPAKGMKLDLRIEPFIEVTDPALSFLRGSVEWRGYSALDNDGYWVIAARVKLGAMLGADADEIPPDERFYAGGGGSIRGFAYKTVSPLRRNDPIGGRSLVETSVELRRRINERFGAAVFLDAGNAYSSVFPDFDEDLRLGAGVGIRYFTPVGPLRIDLAVPLNPREELDDSFGVYVSFGQAF
jgi:translocation and assembly module TamA